MWASARVELWMTTSLESKKSALWVAGQTAELQKRKTCLHQISNSEPTGAFFFQNRFLLIHFLLGNKNLQLDQQINQLEKFQLNYKWWHFSLENESSRFEIHLMGLQSSPWHGMAAARVGNHEKTRRKRRFDTRAVVKPLQESKVEISSRFMKRRRIFMEKSACCCFKDLDALRLHHHMDWIFFCSDFAVFGSSSHSAGFFQPVQALAG